MNSALVLALAVALGGSSNYISRNRYRMSPPSGATADAGTPTLPSGAIINLSAASISGVNGALIDTWEDTGTVADFTQATAMAQPQLLTNASEKALSFDGVFDLVTSAGSKVQTGFIHSTGVFDLIVVLRRTNVNNGTERRILGNCEGQEGISVLFNDGADEGKFWVILGNGSGLITNFTPTTVSAPLGQPIKLLVRGTGTSTRVSTDFSTFETQAFLAALGTGDAFYDFSVGGSNPSQTTPKTLAADVYMVLLYNRNLTTNELADVTAVITSQVGGPL